MKPGRPAPESLLLPARRARVEQVVRDRTRSLVCVLEDVHDPHNVAAVVRTCDCFGLQELHVVEGPTSRYRPASEVTQGSEKWVEVKRWRDPAEAVRALQARGFTVLAARLDPSARSLTALPPRGRLALVFGNEHAGVSPALAAAADGSFQIPMFGFTQSLNVSVAVGVSLSWLVLQRAAAGSPGDLPPEESAELLARFYVRAVRQRGRIYGRATRPPPPRRLQREEDEP